MDHLPPTHAETLRCALTTAVAIRTYGAGRLPSAVRALVYGCASYIDNPSPEVLRLAAGRITPRNISAALRRMAA